LRSLLPQAGESYAVGRNTDPGLTGRARSRAFRPPLATRLITEQDVIARVLARHSQAAAEKFIQEVCWRTYWKGWLEMRPDAWRRFRGRTRCGARGECGRARRWQRPEQGQTGIDAFDAWAGELAARGYLHNHARMWFASIWIFTLRLPWTLGADFFLRHSLDADAASNTLSWRWIAGLQTAGKHHLARADNIARFTEGRFAPIGLAPEATALTEPPMGPALPLPVLAAPDPDRAQLVADPP